MRLLLPIVVLLGGCTPGHNPPQWLTLRPPLGLAFGPASAGLELWGTAVPSTTWVVHDGSVGCEEFQALAAAYGEASRLWIGEGDHEWDENPEADRRWLQTVAEAMDDAQPPGSSWLRLHTQRALRPPSNEEVGRTRYDARAPWREWTRFGDPLAAGNAQILGQRIEVNAYRQALEPGGRLPIFGLAVPTPDLDWAWSTGDGTFTLQRDDDARLRVATLDPVRLTDAVRLPYDQPAERSEYIGELEIDVLFEPCTLDLQEGHRSLGFEPWLWSSDSGPCGGGC